MKILRILVITVCLNVPCAYAMETSAIDSAITAVVATVCVAGGCTFMHDGLCTMTENKGMILLPPVSKNLNDPKRIYRLTVGSLEFGVGFVIVLGLLGGK